MIVEVLIMGVRTGLVIRALTGVIVDIGFDMLDGVEIIVLAAAVLTLEFAIAISYALDVLSDACAGVISCADANVSVMSGMGVDVLVEVMTVLALTMPTCFC